MVGILLSYWDGLFSGAMLVSGRVMLFSYRVYLVISFSTGPLLGGWAPSGCMWLGSTEFIGHEWPCKEGVPHPDPYGDLYTITMII